MFGNNNTVAQSASAIPVAQGIPVYNPYAAAQINPNMLWAYDDDMFDMDDINEFVLDEEKIKEVDNDKDLYDYMIHQIQLNLPVKDQMIP